MTSAPPCRAWRLLFQAAEKSGSRTHRRRLTRLAGFEVRAPHRGANLLRYRRPVYFSDGCCMSTNASFAGRRTSRASPTRRVNLTRSKNSSTSYGQIAADPGAVAKSGDRYPALAALPREFPGDGCDRLACKAQVRAVQNAVFRGTDRIRGTPMPGAERVHDRDPKLVPRCGGPSETLTSVPTKPTRRRRRRRRRLLSPLPTQRAGSRRSKMR